MNLVEQLSVVSQQLMARGLHEQALVARAAANYIRTTRQLYVGLSILVAALYVLSLIVVYMIA